MSHEAFKRVIAHFSGNQSEAARAMGTSQQRISYILDKGNVCPAELVLPAERASGVSRHELRPDLYPVEAPEAAAA